MAQRRNSDSRDGEIEDLKKIIGDQSLVIDVFKKASRGIKMMVLDYLEQEMSLAIYQG